MPTTRQWRKQIKLAFWYLKVLGEIRSSLQLIFSNLIAFIQFSFIELASSYLKPRAFQRTDNIQYWCFAKARRVWPPCSKVFYVVWWSSKKSPNFPLLSMLGEMLFYISSFESSQCIISNCNNLRTGRSWTFRNNTSNNTITLLPSSSTITWLQLAYRATRANTTQKSSKMIWSE